MNCCGHSYKTGEEVGSERSCLLTHPGGLAEEHQLCLAGKQSQGEFSAGQQWRVCVCMYLGTCVLVRISDLLGFIFFFFIL